MAFPSVAATNTSQLSTAGTSHTVNLPTGIVSGNLLIVHFTFAITGQTNPLGWPAGWTQFYFAEWTGGATEGAAGAYRQADGTEGATITVTTSLSTKSAHVSYRITGHENPATQAPESATATGQNGQADPPSLTPTGGAKDYLWLALGANSHPTVYTGAPTNYTNLQTIGTTGGAVGTNTVAGGAEQQLNASAENPGAFSGADAASEWVGATVAVHPPAAPSGDTGITASPFALTGVDANIFNETGLDGQPEALTGADLNIFNEAGLDGQPEAMLGEDQTIYNETGLLASPFALSSTDETIYNETSIAAEPGSLFAQDANIFTESGPIAQPEALTGGDANIFVESGLAGSPLAIFGERAVAVVYNATGLVGMPCAVTATDANIFSETVLSAATEALFGPGTIVGVARPGGRWPPYEDIQWLIDEATERERQREAEMDDEILFIL